MKQPLQHHSQPTALFRRGLCRFLCTLLCALLLCTCALAESGDAHGQVFLFGGSHEEHVYRDMLVLPNGNMLFCCTTDAPPEGQKREVFLSKAWLLCLTPEGDVAWEKFFGEPGTQNVAFSPILLADGRIAVKFHSSKQQNMFYAGVKYFSQEGELLEESDAATPDAPLHNDYFPIENGYVKTHFLENGGRELSLADAEDTAHWTIPIDRILAPRSVLATPEGLVITGGSTQDRDSQIYIPSLYMLSWENGDILWHALLDDHENHWLNAPIATADGGFATLGRRLRDTEWETEPILLKWDRRGALEWERVYSDTLQKQELAIGILELEQGYAILYLSNSGTIINLLITDKQGNEIAHAPLPYAAGIFLGAPSMTLIDGMVWLFDSAEQRNGRYDVAILRLDVEALAKGLMP